MAEQTVKYSARWQEESDAPIEPVNAYMVQEMPPDHILLNVGFGAPPLLDPRDERDWSKKHENPVGGVRRLLLPRELAIQLGREFAKNLPL